MNQFHLNAINFAWIPILPLIAIAVGAMVIMLVGVRVDDEDSGGLGVIALGTLLVAFVLALLNVGNSSVVFSGSIASDDFGSFFELTIIFATAMTIAMSLDYAASERLAGAEYYSLILFSTFGMILMAVAGDLITIFLGLETMSIAVYALAGFMRRDPRSSEGALKYFLLGAFSTGFLLFGIALVYGATGTIRLEPIGDALAAGAAWNPLLLLGLAMMLMGFGFKVAAVPFHMWTPDAYEGAPTPITAFMAVGVKLAAFAGFLRIFLVHLEIASPQWSWAVWVLAALTMTVGNLSALVQSNIKRMLAYSAIANAGYILVAMTAASPEAGGAILYYLLGYAFTNLGAFAIVIALERRGESRALISNYRGLAQTHPGLAAAMTLFLLSLTGVPPLAGFVGKFYVFSAALHAHLTWLVIIGALNSVMSAYYYIYVVVVMYTQEGGVRIERLSGRPGLVIAIAVALVGTILIGCFPQPYMAFAASAFASATAHTPIHAAMIH